MKKMAATKPLDRGYGEAGAQPDAVVNAVSGLCMKCHDTENDPKFDFYEYMPKVYHTGMKRTGLSPVAK